MAGNRIRMGDNDPMDAYTSEYAVDLTQGNKIATPSNSVASNKPINADVSGLNSLDATQEELNKAKEERIAKKEAQVVTGVSMSQNVQEFDPTTLIPKKEKFDPGQNEVMNALDLAIEREKNSITERHRALEEAMYEDHINREIETADPTSTTTTTTSTVAEEEEEDDFYETTSNTYDDQKNFKVADDPIDEKDHEPVNAEKKVTITKTVSDDFEYDEEEMADDLEETSVSHEDDSKKAEEEMNIIVEGLKTAAKDVLKPNMNKIDLSKFKIGKTGVKATTVILREVKDADIADWVMYEAGYPISMSALTGPELIKLDPENSNRNRFNTLKDMYKIIYDHVVDSKKVSFDRWMKQTKYSDLDNIYFALYMATFNSSNFISYQCPDCKKVFITDVKFEDMVKYKDDDVKAKVKEIMTKNTDNGELPFDVDLVQVSDKYVFGMKSPSLYNIVMETAGLPDNILEKYSDLIDTITYIDSVYTIDYTNMELTPIIIPTVKDDPVKSTAKKIKTMYDILKSLSSDEYYILRGYISKITEKAAEITYLIPGAKCPDCDKEIEANESTSAQSLLFTRHHLGAFASM